MQTPYERAGQFEQTRQLQRIADSFEQRLLIAEKEIAELQAINKSTPRTAYIAIGISIISLILTIATHS